MYSLAYAFRAYTAHSQRTLFSSILFNLSSRKAFSSLPLTMPARARAAHTLRTAIKFKYAQPLLATRESLTIFTCVSSRLSVKNRIAARRSRVRGGDEIYASLRRARLFARLARNSTFQRIICRTVYALAPSRSHRKWHCDIYLSLPTAFALAKGGSRCRGRPILEIGKICTEGEREREK